MCNCATLLLTFLRCRPYAFTLSDFTLAIVQGSVIFIQESAPFNTRYEETHRINSLKETMLFGVAYQSGKKRNRICQPSPPKLASVDLDRDELLVLAGERSPVSNY